MRKLWNVLQIVFIIVCSTAAYEMAGPSFQMEGGSTPYVMIQGVKYYFTEGWYPIELDKRIGFVKGQPSFGVYHIRDDEKGYFYKIASVVACQDTLLLVSEQILGKINELDQCDAIAYEGKTFTQPERIREMIEFYESNADAVQCPLYSICEQIKLYFPQYPGVYYAIPIYRHEGELYMQLKNRAVAKVPDAIQAVLQAD